MHHHMSRAGESAGTSTPGPPTHSSNRSGAPGSSLRTSRATAVRSSGTGIVEADQMSRRLPVGVQRRLTRSIRRAVAASTVRSRHGLPHTRPCVRYEGQGLVFAMSCPTLRATPHVTASAHHRGRVQQWLDVQPADTPQTPMLSIDTSPASVRAGQGCARSAPTLRHRGFGFEAEPEGEAIVQNRGTSRWRAPSTRHMFASQSHHRPRVALWAQVSTSPYHCCVQSVTDCPSTVGVIVRSNGHLVT